MTFFICQVKKPNRFSFKNKIVKNHFDHDFTTINLNKSALLKDITLSEEAMQKPDIQF
jgi:hypothetical protein